jgi:hypothetical protein
VTVLVAFASACRFEEPFACSADAQCGAGGRCEAVGYCSFPDSACSAGRRFDELAPGELASECVETVLQCPSTYAVSFAATSSRYRLAPPASWTAARADCADDGMFAHLAVIESDAERLELAAMIADDVWIGFSDRELEGSFRWVTGSPSTFTMWSAGQPEDSDGTEDCVEQKGLSRLWFDQPCDELLAYACECDGVPSSQP